MYFVYRYIKCTLLSVCCIETKDQEGAVWLEININIKSWKHAGFEELSSLEKQDETMDIISNADRDEIW